MELETAIVEGVRRIGREGALGQPGARDEDRPVVEVQIKGDAHGTFRQKKMTNILVLVIGSHAHMHKPDAAYAAVHFAGSDTRQNLEAQCAALITYVNRLTQEAVRRAGGAVSIEKRDSNSNQEGWWSVTCQVTVDFDDGSPPAPVRVQFLLGGDAVFLCALFGGLGFARGKYRRPCLICQAPYDQLGKINKVFKKKTYKYLCNAAHEPDMRDPATAFPFKCPECKKCFADQGAVDSEDRPVWGTAAAKKWGERHPGMRIGHKPLFMIEPIDAPLCSLHLNLANIRHNWQHGPAYHITDDGIAKEMAECLHTKCNVAMKLSARANSSASDQIKLISCNGAQSRAICAAYLLLLCIAFQVTQEQIRDAKEMTSTELSKVDSNVANAMRMDACMDGVRALWNELAARMRRVVEGARSGPIAKEVIAEKVTALAACATTYQMLFFEAHGESCFKPYTHMGCHVAEQQKWRQSDLSDYNGECVEHFGKLMGEVTRLNTNKILKEGYFGYVAQAAVEMHIRKKARTESAVETSHEERLRRESKKLAADIDKLAVVERVVKLETWPDVVLSRTHTTFVENTELARQDDES
jgi:hypothetical protein